MSENKNIIKFTNIQNKIYTIRNSQVMIDRDLAKLYQIETRVLNQAVKRNIDRFPNDFMFQLSIEELNNLTSQIVISKSKIQISSQSEIIKENRGGHRKLPFVFTEQGVSMLSAILKSSTAVKISVSIMRAFVEMRKFLSNNAAVFQRLDNLEYKQLQTDKKIEKVLNALEYNEVKPKRGIFFDGQMFDAYKLLSDIVRSAEKSIILIDNYVDDTTLDLFTKRRINIEVIIYTKNISRTLKNDLEKFNNQYEKISIKKLVTSHDRFLIIDSNIVYHFGASLKDLGKKWFAFSKLDIDAGDLLEKL